MNQVFSYRDYRRLIADRLQTLGITASAVSARLGLKSKSYLGLILRGHKRLQPDQIHLLKDILQLSSSEFEYFFHLVFACDLKTEKGRAYHRRRMDEIRQLKIESSARSTAPAEILTQWFYPTLILLPTLDRVLDPSKLSEILGVPTAVLNAAYEQLIELGLVEKGEDGKYRAQDAKLKFGRKIWSSIQMKYLKEHISAALKRFDRSYEDSGKYYSQTITFSKGSFNEVWANLQDHMDRLADRSDSEQPEEIVQLNLQFYKII